MRRYDFFKAELLKTGYFADNIYLHTTASFAAGTVATTVCSPAGIASRLLSAAPSMVQHAHAGVCLGPSLRPCALVLWETESGEGDGARAGNRQHPRS